MEEILRVAVRESRRLFGDRRYALADPEDNHLAERGDRLASPLDIGLDRLVGQRGHVLAAPIAALPEGSTLIEDRLEGDVRHRLDRVEVGNEVPDRLDRRHPVVRVTDVHGDHPDARLQAVVRGDELLWRSGDDRYRKRELVGRAIGEVAPRPDHPRRLADGPQRHPGEDDRPELVQAEVKAGDDPEVAPTAADPQKRSALSSSLTSSTLPSPVTTSAATRLSSARPWTEDVQRSRRRW